MSWKKAIFPFLIIGAIALAIALGSSFSIFIDIPSFIFVFVLSTLGMFFSFKLRELKKVLVIAFSKELEKFSQSDIELTEKFFNYMITYVMTSGVIGFIVGLVQMLQALDDPGAIGPAMAVALITFCYAAFINLMFLLPLKYGLRNKCMSDSNVDHVSNSAFFISLIPVLGAFILFVFLLIPRNHTPFTSEYKEQLQKYEEAKIQSDLSSMQSADKFGPVIKFGPITFILNSKNGEQLKLAFELLVQDESSIRKIETRKVPITDKIIDNLYGLHLQEVKSKSIIQTLKSRIKESVFAFVPEGLVREIYLTRIQILEPIK
jgi:flagellar motor component MotA/flagellar basal body-associated protein FliL